MSDISSGYRWIFLRFSGCASAASGWMKAGSHEAIISHPIEFSTRYADLIS